jgi:vacuolar-type H+-ATPase subunit H
MVIGTASKNKKTAGKTKTVTIEETSGMPEKSPVAEEQKQNSLDLSMTQMEKAYTSYMEAREQVERAYHENEGLITQACQRAERKAQDTFDASISQALKRREKALNEASREREEATLRVEETFKNASATAEKDYEEAASRAVRERQEALETAWQKRDEVMEQAWNVYSRMSK